MSDASSSATAAAASALPSVSPPRPRRAIFTMVTSDDFCVGAAVLAFSLRRVGTRFPLCAIVTPNLTDASLRELQRSGWTVVTVEPLPSGIRGGHVASWVEVGYTKLRLWQLTSEWDRVLYIDADCVANRSVDHLLDSKSLDRVSFAAAPDIFPPDHFNAGVMLLTPCARVFSAMLRLMSCARSYDGGDTGFLNQFFADWFSSKYSVNRGAEEGREQIVVDLPPTPMPLTATEGSNDPAPADFTVAAAAHVSSYRARTARLSFGYNALRVLQWFTKKAPLYWSEVQSRGRLVTHYCSSPKPWEDRQHRRGGEVEQEYFTALEAMEKERDTRPEVSGGLQQARTIQAPPAVDAAEAGSSSSSAARQAEEEPVQALQTYLRSHMNQTPFGDFAAASSSSASSSGSATGSSGQQQEQEISGAVRPIKAGVWMDSAAEKAFLDKTRSMLRACFEPSSSSPAAVAAPSCIPRRIHQIWLGGALPSAYAAWAQSWVQHNASSRGWLYKLWDDSDFAGFPACASMADETSQQLAAHLRSLLPLCTNVAQRSDLWRLDLLWSEGGLYVDTDFECLGSFDALHSPSSSSPSVSVAAATPATAAATTAATPLTGPSISFYTGFSNVGAVECNNGLIACTPRHPLIAKLILSTRLQPPAAATAAATGASSASSASVTSPVAGATHSAMEIVCSSGPGHFTRTCAEFVAASAEEASGLAFFPAQAFYPLPNSMRHLRHASDKRAFVAPLSMAMHHWSCSWQPAVAAAAGAAATAKEATSDATVAAAAPSTTAQVLAMVQQMQAAKLQQAQASSAASSRPAAASTAAAAPSSMDAALMARIAGFMSK